MSDLERNKQVVVDFYQTAFGGDPAKAIADHLGPRYVQHNPDAQDGPEAFIGFVSWLRGEYPNLKLEIKRVLAEGDMVVTHSHLDLEPGNARNPGRALADFFRLEDGKVVEHWDVIQDIPAKSANENGMFLDQATGGAPPAAATGALTSRYRPISCLVHSARQTEACDSVTPTIGKRRQATCMPGNNRDGAIWCLYQSRSAERGL
jgi:predicted SnoaL-like aldol condensation-catalyzing enzyme